MRQEQSAPAPAPFLETDILSGELADLVGAGDAGKNAVGVAGLHFPQGKIGGDDGRVPVQERLVEMMVECRFSPRSLMQEKSWEATKALVNSVPRSSMISRSQP